MFNKIKRTITTVEQIKTENGIMQRIATHIVTEFHGYSTLCIDGNNIERNDNLERIRDSKVIAENQLPITCPVCFLIWQEINGFTANDFATSKESNFVMTDLKDICLPNE